MAHELQIENGKASMMYVGEVPWHGLGTKLDGPATSAEAIRAAKLDWTVRKVPLRAVEGKVKLAVPGFSALVPSHKWGKPQCPVLGVVGADYRPLQNVEAFGFFDAIVGMDAAIYHTAGALRDGRRIWILAKLPDQIRVVGDDLTDKYLLLSNGHDGATAVHIRFTPVRVVCANTLAMALSDGRSLRVLHRPDLHRRLDEARQLLGLINDRYKQIEVEFKAMAGIQLVEKQLESYLSQVFPDPADPDRHDPLYERLRERAGLDRTAARYFFESGKGNDALKVKGTLWAAYNGVTEYIDHSWGQFDDQQAGRNQRLNSIWFGRGLQFKTKAYREALGIMSPGTV